MIYISFVFVLFQSLPALFEYETGVTDPTQVFLSLGSAVDSPIGIVKRDYGIFWLVGGWSDFVASQGLGMGTIMVFRHHGGVHFDVRVLDEGSICVENGYVMSPPRPVILPDV